MSNRKDQSEKSSTKLRLGGGPPLPGWVMEYLEKHRQQITEAEGVECSWVRFFTRLAFKKADLAAMILNGHGDPLQRRSHKSKVTSAAALASSK